MFSEIREWTMLALEFGIFIVVLMEYLYDKTKDDAKKQKRTKTTKRTTTNKDGSNTVEESTEAVEPINETEKK